MANVSWSECEALIYAQRVKFPLKTMKSCMANVHVRDEDTTESGGVRI